MDSIRDISISDLLIVYIHQKSRREINLYMYSTCAISVSQRRHGQFFGIHVLILLLKLVKQLVSLTLCSTRSHIFVPRFAINSVPYCFVCKIDLIRWVQLLKLQLGLSQHLEFKIDGILIFILKMYYANRWKFCLWIVADLSLANNPSNDVKRSL